MVWVAPSAATTMARVVITRGSLWRCAVASTERSLHQHGIDPAFEFVTRRPDRPDHRKAEPPVQRNRGAVGAVANHGDDLPKPCCFAFREQRQQQPSPDASADPCQ